MRLRTGPAGYYCPTYATLEAVICPKGFVPCGRVDQALPAVNGPRSDGSCADRGHGRGPLLAGWAHRVCLQHAPGSGALNALRRNASVPMQAPTAHPAARKRFRVVRAASETRPRCRRRWRATPAWQGRHAAPALPNRPSVAPAPSSQPRAKALAPGAPPARTRAGRGPRRAPIARLTSIAPKARRPGCRAPLVGTPRYL